MELYLIILLAVVGVGCAVVAVLMFLDESYGYAIIFAILTILVLVVVILSCVTFKCTEWKEISFVYIEEINDGNYFIQGDDKYIYRVKKLDVTAVDIEDIEIEKYVEIEVKYLEDENSIPYLQTYSRWENYHELTRYVFYIPEVE